MGEMKPSNCHPFSKKDNNGRTWVLVHNGTIFESPILKEYEDCSIGETDSEKIYTPNPTESGYHGTRKYQTNRTFCKECTAEEIKEYVMTHMAKHKVPRYVMFVDNFPMNAAGKILKYKMREDAKKLPEFQEAAKIVTA